MRYKTLTIQYDEIWLSLDLRPLTNEEYSIIYDMFDNGYFS